MAEEGGVKKFLKNYTSDVPVFQTINRIQAVLIKCGVNGITMEYGPDGVVSAMRFHYDAPSGEITVRLPADFEAAQNALWLNYADGESLSKDGSKIDEWGSRKNKKRSDFKAQADRTAWKIIQDWVEVQMSMIQLKQAEVQQVFMPYIWDGHQTFYERIKANGYRALLPEKIEA
jgi:hypothetical protein